MTKKKVVIICIVSILLIIAIISSFTVGMLKFTSKGQKDSNVNYEQAKVSEESLKTVQVESNTQTSARAENEARTVSTENWNLDNVNIVNDTAGIPVPVPKGYVASGIEGEHTINTGFVIYEGEEAVTEENKTTAQATRNQWVWVPIYDASQIYGTDQSGVKHGKLYSYSEKGRTALNWIENNGIMTITNLNSSNSYREPDAVSNFDYDSYIQGSIAEEAYTLNNELYEEFENTVHSVEKYGGFYIARYETGDVSGEAKVVKGNTDISKQTWYTMYEKCKNLKVSNNVKTSMIWGCLWDATLEWLVESGNKTYYEIAVDSSSWGNCSNTKITYTNQNGQTVTSSGGIIPTGSSETTKANNIYDLVGNVCDRTLEVTHLKYRVYRAGAYNGIGNKWTAAVRFLYPGGIHSEDAGPGDKKDYIGCRAAMYIR